MAHQVGITAYLLKMIRAKSSDIITKLFEQQIFKKDSLGNLYFEFLQVIARRNARIQSFIYRHLAKLLPYVHYFKYSLNLFLYRYLYIYIYINI